ncbi:choice-of-anchor L domain-containing protein [Jiangella alkaliphila]|uniref:LPXTG-motif cell wall anchor domain-containing protein n=1 Tax=Jiangella alkaliphila TaxID=419479 RepID=A0A1H2L3Q4_9ACTN|nr:choice-of-anchor L domain-containing protein [Jiangella alkaliphila]SDU75653.1 LPXTG-motif cell wall anchor domain-containing protein [Jiangella alkaliphila]
MRSLSSARRTSALAAGAVLLIAAGAPAALAAEDARGSSAPVSAKGEGVGDQTVADLDTGGLTADEIVQTLVGDGVTVDNVEYNGSPLAAGLAGGFDDVFGVPGGVALSSGSVGGERSSILGPNVADDMTTEHALPGDADLDPLSTFPTTDAAVLEFDFVPETEQIRFDYIFGSDEYNEYVDSQYNDVFGFFVNGENCAVVGEDAQPISINTINAGSNAELFVDNELPGDGGEAAHATELDGFTTVLTCAADVTAGETNHIKLAVADASDLALDSTVIIAAGTFEANHPPVADDQAVETVVDTPVDITLTGTDEDGDELTYELASEPENGTLSGEAPDLTYTPAEGYTGDDAFTFTVSDGTATSEPATVTITVVEEPTPTPTPTETASPSPSPSETGEPLPDTGSGDLGLPLAAAVLLGIVGLAFVLRGRRTTA